MKVKLLIGDYIIIFLAILLTGFLFFVFPQFQTVKANYANIIQDGEIIKVVDLSTDQEFTIESDHGFNLVKVIDGTIGIIDSDCHNNVCIDAGFQELDGAVIVCLPHKLIIEVTSKKAGEVDGVSR